ncbi:hypothetical protein GCM10020000_85160 [Streptomyces olivoverticillatus]
MHDGAGAVPASARLTKGSCTWTRKKLALLYASGGEGEGDGQPDNTDIEDGDGKGGSGSPGH